MTTTNGGAYLAGVDTFQPMSGALHKGRQAADRFKRRLLWHDGEGFVRFYLL